jgi:hypothetical protein
LKFPDQAMLVEELPCQENVEGATVRMRGVCTEEVELLGEAMCDYCSDHDGKLCCAQGVYLRWIRQ